MKALKKSLSAMFDHINECMAPIIPIVLAGGIFKMVVILLTSAHVLTGTTEVILSAIATTPFYFLPVTVAYSSAKHFDTDPMLAIVSVCVFFFPDFAALMESGGKITFAEIPVVPATYAYSVIPIILLIYCMSRIAGFFKRVIKESLQPYLFAACVIFATALLGILVIEPAVSLLSNALADVLNTMQNRMPVATWGIFAGLTMLLVSTGMHWIFITLAITQIGLTGVDYGIMAAFLIFNMGLAGCDLGVFIKSKNREMKTMCLGAMIAALIPGISEPSIFGVCLKEKTPAVANILGCMAAGMVQGAITVHTFIYTFPSIPSVLMFYSGEEPDNLMKAILVAVVSFAACMAFTLLLYRDKANVVGEEN